MKAALKHLAARLMTHVDQLRYYVDYFGWKKLDHLDTLQQQTQQLLAGQYQERHARGQPQPRLDDVEFRAFSQHGEDGILLYLFALLGTTDKRVVELCAGDGVECNAANLIVYHGWHGWLFDGDDHKLDFGRRFYARHLNTLPAPPALVHAWVEAETVNALVAGHGVSGEIDLLSLDLDGVDYWVWQALDSVRPRVVVLEFNRDLGGERALTMPYRRDFVAKPAQPKFYGASLPAFVKLASRKGYRLVGCEHFGVNAFFVRTDLGLAALPEVRAEDCFRAWPPTLSVPAGDWMEV